MALAWTLTDGDAKNVYTKMCNWYQSPENLPNKINDSGVFFGYANFTRDKLVYCIEYLKKCYGRGWFTDDREERVNVFDQIASELYSIFGGSVDINGIVKFLNWVYNFARHDSSALTYFQGGYYSLVQSMAETAKSTILEPISEAVETVKYGVQYPSFTLSNPLVKWGLILGGVYIIFKSLKR